jgi:hypothetical protein
MAVTYDTLFGWDPRVEVAVISGAVGFLTALVTPYLRHHFDRRLQTYRLRTENEYAHRKALRRLIGSFHGRLVEAADLFNFRMLNLYRHREERYRGKRWLDVSDDEYGDFDRYYFHSTVLRFLTLLSLVTHFEKSAFFIESELGSERDVWFLFFAKAMRRTVTDTELFSDVKPQYDPSVDTDHFYTDQLRDLCTFVVQKGDTEMGLYRFTEAVGQADRVTVLKALRFFQDLKPEEQRLRWDRMVALHLVVMAFLNEFGYAEQHASPKRFAAVANQIRNKPVADNLVGALSRLHLGARTKALKAAAEKVEPGVAKPFDYLALDDREPPWRVWLRERRRRRTITRSR